MSPIQKPVQTQTTSTSLPQPIQNFVKVALTLTAICLLTELVCNFRGLGYPFVSPVLPFIAPYQDLLMYADRYAAYHSRAFFAPGDWQNLYPAPATVIYKLLFLTGHPQAVFLSLAVAAILGASTLLWRNLVQRGVGRPSATGLLLALAASAYPFLFEFRQGNIEVLLWFLLGTGIVCFLRRSYLPFALLLGIVGSMKLYPFALLGLLVARKRYRDIAISLAVGVMTTITSLWLACPDIAYSWKRTQEGVQQFQRMFTLSQWVIGHDHSLFAVLKRVVDASLMRSGHPWLSANVRLLSIYLPVALLLGFYISFIAVRRLPVVNGITAIIVAMILLPPTSYDYTLMHLYVPFALLCFCAVEQRRNTPQGLRAALVCLAILFAPETAVISHATSLGGQIKALALLTLLFITARYPFRTSFDEEKEFPHLREQHSAYTAA